MSASQQYRGVMVGGAGGALGVSEKGGPLSPHMEGEEGGGDEKEGGHDNDDEDELLMASEKYEKSIGGGGGGGRGVGGDMLEDVNVSQMPLVVNTNTDPTSNFSSGGNNLHQMDEPILNGNNGQGEGGSGDNSGGNSSKDVVQNFMPIESSTKSLHDLTDSLLSTHEPDSGRQGPGQGPGQGQGQGQPVKISDSSSTSMYNDDEENIQSMSLASYHAYTSSRK